jgi:threonine/homoserine/homoserine lactone efflux protein
MSASALGAIFGTSFLVSLTGALSPGPLSTLAAREGVQKGFWAGPALAAGHGSLELALVIGLALGLNQLLEREAVAATIALVGGLFLLWLGAQVIRTAPARELHIQHHDPALPPRHTGGLLAATDTAPSLAGIAALMLAGVAVSISNPFWLAWWATIGTAYIVEALDQGVAGVASFYSAHLLTDLGWLSLIAFALARGRRIMSRWAYRLTLTACGVFLLGLGGWFLASGLGYLV